MNIVEKVSRYNKTQNMPLDAEKSHGDAAVVSFAQIKKELPKDVKNKLFDLHQKYAGVKEATIYNLMKKHEFKYNLVENELKMLVINKRSFSTQGQQGMTQSMVQKKTGKDQTAADRNNRTSYGRVKKGYSHREERAERNSNKEANNFDEGASARDHKDDGKKDTKGEAGDPKYRHDKNLRGKEAEGNYNKKRGLGRLLDRNDKYKQPYNSNSRFGNRSMQNNRNYTKNARRSNYAPNGIEYVKKSNGKDEHPEHQETQGLELKEEHRQAERLLSGRDLTGIPKGPKSNGKLSKPLLNEEQQEESEENVSKHNIGLFAEPDDNHSDAQGEEMRRAADRLVTALQKNMLHYFSVLKNAKVTRAKQLPTVPERKESPQHAAHKPNDYKYKKKAIDVDKAFKIDIDESSSHFGTNKVDVLVKKQFESEEEKLKSSRERRLEKKIDDMAEIISTMQHRINVLETMLQSKTTNTNSKRSDKEDNVYCMVPYHMVKGLFTPVNATDIKNGYDAKDKIFTMNLVDS